MRWWLLLPGVVVYLAAAVVTVAAAQRAAYFDDTWSEPGRGAFGLIWPLLLVGSGVVVFLALVGKLGRRLS